MRYERAIAVGWGLVTLLLGAALGGVYTLITGDWHNGTTWGELWLTVGLTVVAAAIATGCLVSVRGRDRMLARTGTAYIIKEQARGWDTDDAGKFLAESRRQFARVISVPGPATLDKGWDWALGDAASPAWDAKLDSLAVAFRALHADDDPSSPNGVFMWAWWSVAMAFGMRVVAAERGLALDVWQRPSFGRTAQEAPVPWATRPHDFESMAQPAVTPLEFEWPVRVTTTHAGLRAAPVGGRASGVTVLLIRVGRQEWGGIPDAGVTPRPESGRRYDLEVRDAAGVLIGGKLDTVVHEFRYDVPIRSVPWIDYPALVMACADWVVRRAGSLKGQVLLLGMVVPQEVSLGLGIRAGRVARDGWPSRLWPLMHDEDNGGFVVPRLNLGTAPVEPGK